MQEYVWTSAATRFHRYFALCKGFLLLLSMLQFNMIITENHPLVKGRLVLTETLLTIRSMYTVCNREISNSVKKKMVRTVWTRVISQSRIYSMSNWPVLNECQPCINLLLWKITGYLLGTAGQWGNHVPLLVDHICLSLHLIVNVTRSWNSEQCQLSSWYESVNGLHVWDPANYEFFNYLSIFCFMMNFLLLMNVNNI